MTKMPVKTVASVCSDLIAVYKNKSMELCGWQRSQIHQQQYLCSLCSTISSLIIICS